MKKQLFILFLITFSCLKSLSQINFENGYFINESNQKIECLIKNVDWKNNPTEFEYKLSINEKVQNAKINTVKEFAINNVSKYIKVKTNIDRSSNQINELTSERNPNFKEEILFLKELIEGQASLYQYNDGNLTRFFYKLEDSEIKQLVYKEYLVDQKISKNEYFKQQLFLELKCEGIQIKDLEQLRYKKSDLLQLFIKYHECKSSNYIRHEPKQKKDLFNLTFRPSLNLNSLKIENPSSNSEDTDFGNSIGVKFGIEAELILPYNKNKWSIIVEPTYQNYNSENKKESSNVSGGIIISKVDYKSIQIPIGIRHYFYLNNNSKIFTNISYVIDFENNSTIKFLRQDNSLISSLNIKSRPNFAIGVGYKLKNTYSVEIRYNLSQNILSDYLYWNSEYKTISLALGYSIF